jgi:superfamily I DNA and/or RNA helicase
MNSLSESDRGFITVDTVERFQGSERDFIIYSVPTKSVAMLDILCNTKTIDNIPVDRKLNVAITRARKKFVMLGHYQVLSQNPIYKRLIEDLH